MILIHNDENYAGINSEVPRTREVYKIGSTIAHGDIQTVFIHERQWVCVVGLIFEGCVFAVLDVTLVGEQPISDTRKYASTEYLGQVRYKDY